VTLLQSEAPGWSDGWPSRTALLPVAPVSVGLHDDRPIGGSHDSQDLRMHHAAWGPRPDDWARRPESLLESMAEVALSGRGGAHFPVAVKWRAVLAAGGGGTVVANAAEGEPASAKDGVLLRARPHLVLDGLATAAGVLGATDVVIWLHGGATETQHVLSHALAERRAARLPEPPVRVVRAPDGYISGESSAVVRALSGGPALPDFAVLPAAAAGVHGRPTLVQNAETLARVAVLSRTGAEDYAASALLTIVGGGRRVVVERPTTSTLAAAVAAAGHVLSDEPQAVLLGGYGGAWLPWTKAAGLPLDEPTLRAAGTSIGAGVMAPLPAGACGLVETASVFAFLAASSARQCGPCLFGLRSISAVLDDLSRGRARRRDVERIQRHAAQVSGRGACRHPDGAIWLMASALSTFAADVRAHAAGSPCPGSRRAPSLPVPRVG
jgi:NADH:ubiquinone oxidoreductase subunit F (NADH-binding)